MFCFTSDLCDRQRRQKEVWRNRAGAGRTSAWGEARKSSSVGLRQQARSAYCCPSIRNCTRSWSAQPEGQNLADSSLLCYQVWRNQGGEDISQRFIESWCWIYLVIFLCHFLGGIGVGLQECEGVKEEITHHQLYAHFASFEHFTLFRMERNADRHNSLDAVWFKHPSSFSSQIGVLDLSNWCDLCLTEYQQLNYTILIKMVGNKR